MTGRRKPVIVRDHPITPSQSGVAHWACPDCGTPCYCIDDLVRRSPHLPCGLGEAAALHDLDCAMPRYCSCRRIVMVRP